ncbi:MAG: hypothetical protein HFACDABA_02027 [Anaerolineales bacterium]|nr:hypothetical protein [Anaerolineales bacterium]
MNTMSTDAVYIRRLAGDEDIHADIFGNKTSVLARLFRAGYPVPHGFCIPVGYYYEHVERAKAEITVAHVSMKEAVLAAPLDPAFSALLVSGYRALTEKNPGPVAVRSSSLAEDLPGHSFAGLYETILGVHDEDALTAAVKRCWASYWNEEAVLYRREAGIPDDRQGMAVLVQTMIAPRCAGVLFTRNPLAPREETLVIEALPKQGEAVVSGEERAERYFVGRASQSPAEIKRSPEGCLSLADCRRLAELGLAIERLQGAPQDIEWCIDRDNLLWILQSRPMTRKKEAGAVNGEPGWIRSYPEPFSTLGADLAIQRHAAWVRAINSYYRTRFRSEMKSTGLVLYHTDPWMNPGRATAFSMNTWKAIRWFQGGAIHRRFSRGILPAFEQRLRKLKDASLSDLEDREIEYGLREAIEEYLQFQVDSLPMVKIAIASASVLRRFCQLVMGNEEGTQAFAGLMTGLDNLTVERDLALQSLSRLLRGALDPDERQDLSYAALEKLGGQSPRGREFWQALEKFQERFGYIWADRYPRDPAWEINDEALAISLASLVFHDQGRDLEANRKGRERERIERVAGIRAKVASGGRAAWFPARLALFDALSKKAAEYFPYREDRNHYVYWAVMVIRRYAREWGRRLAERKMIPAPEDIFFLTMEELRSTFHSPASASMEKISARRAEYERARQLLQVETRAGRSPDKAGGRTIRGDACSPGIASGRAHIVSGLHDLSSTRPGDVLICRTVRPAYSFVFARVQGLVCETGSLLSHGATLAREYGVPAVMNIPDLFDRVGEGDELIVDGSNGSVRVVR